MDIPSIVWMRCAFAVVDIYSVLSLSGRRVCFDDIGLTFTRRIRLSDMRWRRTDIWWPICFVSTREGGPDSDPRTFDETALFGRPLHCYDVIPSLEPCCVISARDSSKNNNDRLFFFFLPTSWLAEGMFCHPLSSLYKLLKLTPRLINVICHLPPKNGICYLLSKCQSGDMTWILSA